MLDTGFRRYDGVHGTFTPSCGRVGMTRASSQLPIVTLPSGETVPLLGQGTWRLGENRRAFDAEVAALKLGLDLGMTLIDTAELYGEGGAEEVVAKAIEGRREDCFMSARSSPRTHRAPAPLPRASAA